MSEKISDELDDLIHGRGMEYGQMGTYTERISRFLDRHVIIPCTRPADNEIKEDGRMVTAGSGPEYAAADIGVNPNWLRNKALNHLAIADYLENRDAILAAKEAEASAARDKRRDELVNELAPRSPGLGGNWYMNVSIGLRKAVDRIIDMEDAAK